MLVKYIHTYTYKFNMLNRKRETLLIALMPLGKIAFIQLKCIFKNTENMYAISPMYLFVATLKLDMLLTDTIYYINIAFI